MPRHYYDTSKFLSLPTTLIGCGVVLIILILVGVRYGGFNEFLFTDVDMDSSDYGFENADGTPLTFKECSESYETCTFAAGKFREKCDKRAEGEFNLCTKNIPDDLPVDEFLQRIEVCTMAHEEALMSCDNQQQRSLDKCDEYVTECQARAHAVEMEEQKDAFGELEP